MEILRQIKVINYINYINYILFFSGLASFLLSSCVIRQAIYKYKVEEPILHKNAEVKEVEVLYDHGVFDELTVLIIFHDGRKLVLTRVDTKLEGDIQIMAVGNYGVIVYFNSHSYAFSKAIYAEFISREITKPLKTVNDIIEHYDDLYKYIDNLYDWDSEKYADADKLMPDWVWDHKWGFEASEYNNERLIAFKKKWEETEYYWYY